MASSTEIKRALQEALGVNPNLPITAEVVSIQNRTCTVKLLSELVLTDIRLCATISDEADGLVIVPKIGSEVVLISQTGQLSGLMVIKVDAVERIEYKKGDFEFIINGTDGKVTIKNQNANVGKLIGNLINTISNAIIQTPAGVGNFGPTTKQQLTALKNQFKSILNDT